MGSALQCELLLSRMSCAICWNVRANFKPVLDYACALCAPLASGAAGVAAEPVRHAAGASSRSRVAWLGLPSLVHACVPAVSLELALPCQSVNQSRSCCCMHVARFPLEGPAAATFRLFVCRLCSSLSDFLPAVMLRALLLCVAAVTARSQLPPGISGTCLARLCSMLRGAARQSSYAVCFQVQWDRPLMLPSSCTSYHRARARPN